MTRSDHLTGTDRLAEVAASLDCDLIVNVQGDEPLIEPDTIDAAIEPFRNDPALLMSTVCTAIFTDEAIADPNVVKVVTDRARVCAVFLTIARFLTSAGTLRPGSRLYKHLGLYVYRREFLHIIASLRPTALERSESLEQLRVLENGYAIQVIETPHDSIGVDTPEDLERVRRLLTAECVAAAACPREP